MAGNVLLSAIFPDVIFRVNTAEKNLYLTFDDGPAEVTPWVLEELKKFNAQVTFFCVGANIEKNIPLFNEIINRKHTIGNHTMNHLNGWKTKTKKQLRVPNDLQENEYRHDKRTNLHFALCNFQFSMFFGGHNKLLNVR